MVNIFSTSAISTIHAVGSVFANDNSYYIILANYDQVQDQTQIFCFVNLCIPFFFITITNRYVIDKVFTEV